MPDKKKQELQTFAWKNDQNAPHIYGNYLHVGWTLDDVRLVFGLIHPENVNKGEFIALERGTVVLSWRQTKNLRDMLDRVVKSYEVKNGPITDPLLAEPKETERTSEG